MISATSYALAGLQAASTQFNARADNIANLQTANYQRAVPLQTSTPAGPQVAVRREAPAPQTAGAPPNDVRLEDELVAAKLSETAYKAAARVLRAADDITQETLDILT